MNFSVNMNYYEQLPEKIEEKQKYLDEWQKNDDEIYAYCTDIRIKEMVIKQAAQKAGLTVADEDVKLSVKSNIENNREYEPEFFQNTLEALEMTLEEYENFRFETTKISALCNLYKNDWLEKNASSLKELDETKLLAAYDEHVAGLVSAAEIVKY
jgi:hypothetical protein